MKFIQDSKFAQGVSLCEAILSGNASKSVLDTAKSVLESMPPEMRKQVARSAVQSGKPSMSHGDYHNRPSIPCALAWL